MEAAAHVYITDIQRYSIHNGDGIRTTVYFKGCPLKCRWCHNPENISYLPELMFDPDRSKDARSLTGREYTVNELVKIIEKDSLFYETSSGGVTLSGGEVMARSMDFIETLVRALKTRGFHIAVDTCGYAPYENFRRILNYTDIFLYDIKHMDPKLHELFTGVSSVRILDNLVKLSRDGANIRIRLPIIAGVNADDGHIETVAAFLRDIRISGIDLLPYHSAGNYKYERLNRASETAVFQTPDKELLDHIKNKFISAGYHNVRISGGEN
ncbi:MAG: glycyl-radical enzyme activating protein [Clostridiales bacterium]|jgi:pyruvate formate lyase activating enzyme|nr:glycyl-radical enzyme activating protein [Clostridiales bacterium]